MSSAKYGDEHKGYAVETWQVTAVNITSKFTIRTLLQKCHCIGQMFKIQWWIINFLVRNPGWVLAGWIL